MKHAIEEAHTTIRVDANGVYMLCSDRSTKGYVVERALVYCPFCGHRLFPAITHRLAGILDQANRIRVKFTNGSQAILTDCYQVDYSIYGKTGLWCCMIERQTSADNKACSIKKTNSLCDICEDDIAALYSDLSGEVLFDRAKEHSERKQMDEPNHGLEGTGTPRPVRQPPQP
jgi:hypothetical protein